MQSSKNLVQINKKPKRNIAKYLILPAIIFVAIITQIPFIMTIIISFMKWNVKRPDMPITFAGLDNYIYIFSDSNFYRVLLNSLIQAVASLALCTVLGFFWRLCSIEISEEFTLPVR